MKIIGHQARWRALARAFQNNRAPQTLLISGPPNIGKTTLITRYAQLLLCPNLFEEDGLPAPCEKCSTCHQIGIGTFPDFRVFRPQIGASDENDAPEELESSSFSVGKARLANQEVMKKALSGPRKVVILTQFERANESAQNALLKTLEEPPASVSLILTSENVRQLRATILSRCWHLPLTPVGDEEIARWLREQFPSGAPADVAASLRAAHGRPGAAFREMKRLGESESSVARAEIAAQMLAKLDHFAPVGALGLSEEATQWAKIWWEEDTGDAGDPKKIGAKANRSALARFLEELALAGHQRWVLQRGALESHNAARLELIRKTRSYILRNANDSLALNAMFTQLIALRAADVSNSGVARAKPNSR